MEILLNGSRPVERREGIYNCQERVNVVERRYAIDLGKRKAKKSHLDDSVDQHFHWRRAGPEHIEHIRKLMNLTHESIDSLFNYPRIDHLVEKCHFPIVQLDIYGNVVSFTAYEIYPNVPSVPSFAWVEWLHQKYRLEDANSGNSLFIHYMVWHPSHEKDFLRFLLKIPFLEFIHLQYIILVKPPFAHVPEVYEQYFVPVMPFGMSNPNDAKGFHSVQSVNLCLRHTMVESLLIRKAITEDCDSLMSLLQSKDALAFEKLYGKYFFAEFVEFADPHRYTLVCETKGDIAGVMSINLNIDLDFLTEEFELIPFHGLRKCGENDTYVPTQNLPSFVLDVEGWYQREMLRMRDSQSYINYYALPIYASTIDLKIEDESSSSSESTYDIDFSVLNISSSLQNFMSIEGITDDDTDVDVGLKVKPTRLTSSTAIYREFKDESLQSKDIVNRKRYINRELTSLHSFRAPIFIGAPNAFAIEIYAVDDDKIDERLCLDFLRAAFELVSNMDYCIITCPSQNLTFPLLDHFIRVNHRPSRQTRQELYVCHRSFLKPSIMSVRFLKESDLDEIRNFIQRIYNRDVIMSEFQDSFAASATEKGFALVAYGQIVGIALLRFDQILRDVHIYFDFSSISILDVHTIENRSVLRHLLLSPAYHDYSRFFLMDIMRLADVTCLFHVLHQEDELEGSIISILKDLVPLKPRKTIRTRKLGAEESMTDRTKLTTFDKPFALFFINSKICSRMKLDVNKNIVVIGASITAFSFFENFLFRSSRTRISYNNLIWISTHGSGLEVPSDEFRNLLFPINSKFDSDYCSMLSLKTHVHIIPGVMTGINRDEKYVIVNRDSIIKYDVLIITVGLQFTKPMPEANRSSTKDCHKNKFFGSTLSRFLVNATPKLTETTKPADPTNMFIINTPLEAHLMLKILRTIRGEMKSGFVFENKIIVYGHNIRVFLLLQTLLKLGIPGDMIAFIEPFPSREVSVTVFGDTSIDSAVTSSIKKCQILYYPEYFLYDWNISTSNRISSITFHTSNAQVTLQCLIFLPLQHKLVTDVNYTACNNAGLVYDGKLVIDRNFRTNDHNIFAAGPFTRYSRRYGGLGRDHQYYHSGEIGRKLAQFVRQVVDPTVGADVSDDDDDDNDNNDNDDESDGSSDELSTCQSLPDLKEPLMVYGQVPGDYYYLAVRKPGKTFDFDSRLSYGQQYDPVLTTGDCQMTKSDGYFRIHLDQFGCVDGIMCFTRKEIDYMKFYSLYGLSEKLLNNLLYRYHSHLISDFFAYFREPWTEAIFHTDFSRLYRRNMGEFRKEEHLHPRSSLLNKITQSLKAEDSTPHKDLIKKFEKDYDKSLVKTRVKRNVLNFLTYFEDELKNYATPSKVEQLLDYDSSPLMQSSGNEINEDQ